MTVSATLHTLQTPTEAQVYAAEAAWARGLIEIGKVYMSGGDFRAQAAEMITQLYDFDQGPVLFKPTLASKAPLRTSYDDAMSYFVGGKHAEDQGFALKPWSAVRFGHQVVKLRPGGATAMGTYFFSPVRKSAETRVEFTFGYRLNADGALKIELHHSSLPYSPALPAAA